jgi:hypothetical protein
VLLKENDYKIGHEDKVLHFPLIRSMQNKKFISSHYLFIFNLQ